MQNAEQWYKMLPYRLDSRLAVSTNMPYELQDYSSVCILRGEVPRYPQGLALALSVELQEVSVVIGSLTLLAPPTHKIAV